ncbi:MAG TPA: thioredoxin domain-containing protein [Ktedonobacteraceae bacterium]|jgi:thioredoxin 1
MMEISDLVLTVIDQNFAEKVLHVPLPVIVDFTAAWCSPCSALAPVFARLSRTYAGKLCFARMDTDENVQTPVRFGIQGMPTLVLFANGQPVGRLVGPHPARLQQSIDRLLAHASLAQQATEASQHSAWHRAHAHAKPAAFGRMGKRLANWNPVGKFWKWIWPTLGDSARLLVPVHI